MGGEEIGQSATKVTFVVQWVCRVCNRCSLKINVLGRVRKAYYIIQLG